MTDLKPGWLRTQIEMTVAKRKFMDAAEVMFNEQIRPIIIADPLPKVDDLPAKDWMGCTCGLSKRVHPLWCPASRADPLPKAEDEADDFQPGRLTITGLPWSLPKEDGDAPPDPIDPENWSADGAKWAAAFRLTAIRLGYSDMDEGWLIGWFANAIERGLMVHPDTLRAKARIADLEREREAADASAARLRKELEDAKDALVRLQSVHELGCQCRWCKAIRPVASNLTAALQSEPEIQNKPQNTPKGD